MQTQDAHAEILFKLWPWLEANKSRLIGALVAVIVAMGILYLISSQRAQKEVDAGQALTMLMVNAPAGGQTADAYTQVATKYTGTAAGQRAQLQAATAMFDAGKYADAQTQFQKFLDANPAGPLAATAQLGVAASLEAQNKTDLAVSAYQRVVSRFAGSSSIPEAEFALGRIAEQQNKLSEAETHYENAARAAMGGSLMQEASVRAAQLKMKLMAAAPKTVAPATTPKAVAPATTATPAAK